MKKILLILLVLLLIVPLIFSDEPRCFRPPVVSCEGAKAVLDCMENEIYYGSGPGFIVNLLYDFWIDLEPGEVCEIDLGNGIYQSNVKVFHITGGPDATISLKRGTIVPLGISGYYGIFVTEGVKNVRLEDITIAGFRSFTGGHALSLVGSHNLYTRNVHIYDSGIGIAASGDLYWVGENTWVWGNGIGLFVDDYFGGTGSYTTWICNNVVDVDMGSPLDLVAKSFKADFVVPHINPDYSSLFESCAGFSPPTGGDDNETSCPDLPTPVARSSISNLPKGACVNVSDPLLNLDYNSYAYEEGSYVLRQIGNGIDEVLDSSYLSGYAEKSTEVLLGEGRNDFILLTTASASNECGTRTTSDIDYACVIYLPSNCTAYVDDLYLNGVAAMGLSEFTVYMHSPAYLNVSAQFSGNYTSCSLYLDGEPVSTINSSQNTLNETLVFLEEGTHTLSLSCQDKPCNEKSLTLYVKRGNKTCDNGVDITNLPNGACMVVRNITSFTALVSAYSVNKTSTLNVYLNGDQIYSGSLLGSTSLSFLTSTTTYQTYTYYAEVVSEDNQCFDSDVGCIIVEPPEEECYISLSGYLPSGRTYANSSTLEKFKFDAASNYNLQCEFTVNGTLIYTGSGTTVSYDQSYILGPGVYDSYVNCYAPSKPSCSKQLSGHLVVSNYSLTGGNGTTCDLELMGMLPSGYTNESLFNYSFNATSSETIECRAWLNSTVLYQGTGTNVNYSTLLNLSDGTYLSQVYCYQLTNVSCNARLEGRLNVSRTSPPPELCYIYMDANLPYGTYINETNTSLWYYAISNYPMNCSLSLNSSLLYNETGLSSQYNNSWTFGIGSYLFNLICESNVFPDCKESRVSSLFVINETLTPRLCNITLNASLPSGTYNNSWNGSLYASVIGDSSYSCNVSLNGTLIGTFNSSYNQSFSFGVGDYLFSIVCVDLANSGCVDSAFSSLHVNIANTSIPRNVSCSADVSFRDLPQSYCKIVESGGEYIVSYSGYVSRNATVSFYHNDDLISSKRVSAGGFSRNMLVELVNGTNVFLVRVDAGYCGASDSACIYVRNQTPENYTCDIGVSSSATLTGNEVNYRVIVDGNSSCRVLLDGTVVDSFTVVGSFIKNYGFNLSAGNHTLEITCVESYCSNTSKINLSIVPACTITGTLIPSGCSIEETPINISYQLYANLPSYYSLYLDNSLLRDGNFSNYFQDSFVMNFSPGIYTLKLNATNDLCFYQTTGCFVVKNESCLDGLNLTFNGTYYKVEGSRGTCSIIVDDVSYANFNYNGTVEGTISGAEGDVSLVCYDEVYCPVVSSLTTPTVTLDVSILTNESGLKLTPDNNATNITYKVISSVNENITCSIYLDGILLGTETVLPGIHNKEVSFDRPGIYDVGIRCELNGTTAGTRKHILIYYVTMNDTTAPTIHLIAPPDNVRLMKFPPIFFFLAFDDLDPMLDCRLNVYDKYGENILSISTVAPNGRQKPVYSQRSHTLFKDDIYYWNVTCVDNGDPVGYSDTWKFLGTDYSEEVWNFVYSNQSIYYTYNNSTVKIYYGVHSNLSYVNTSVYINDVPMILWENLSSNVLYASYLELPPGEYNLTIVSEYNGTFITNGSSFHVVELTKEIIFYNNLTTDKTIYYTENIAPVQIFYNVSHNLQSNVPSLIYINDTLILNGSLSVNTTYSQVVGLSQGRYNITLISKDDFNNTRVSSVEITVISNETTNETFVFYNRVNASSDKYYTNNTSNVPINYLVHHSNQSAVSSVLYLNNTVILNGTLVVDYVYNQTLELNPGDYVITLVSTDNNGYRVLSQDTFKVIQIHTEKEDEEKDVKEVLPKLFPTSVATTQPLTLSTGWGFPAFIIALVVGGALIWFFLWRKPIAIVELLNEPYVNTRVEFRVRDKNGKPVPNVMLLILGPEGREYTVSTDNAGIASFIPEKSGTYSLKPIKHKLAPNSLSSFMVKENV